MGHNEFEPYPPPRGTVRLCIHYSRYPQVSQLLVMAQYLRNTPVAKGRPLHVLLELQKYNPYDNENHSGDVQERNLFVPQEIAKHKCQAVR